MRNTIQYKYAFLSKENYQFQKVNIDSALFYAYCTGSKKSQKFAQSDYKFKIVDCMYQAYNA